MLLTESLWWRELYRYNLSSGEHADGNCIANIERMQWFCLICCPSRLDEGTASFFPLQKGMTPNLIPASAENDGKIPQTLQKQQLPSAETQSFRLDFRPVLAQGRDGVI